MIFNFVFITICWHNSEHRLGVNGSEDIRKEPFFRQDQWTWEKIRTCVPPVVPELKSETDTTYFDDIDDLPQPQQKSASPMVSTFDHALTIMS